jgi:RHS repeat-associated protein
VIDQATRDRVAAAATEATRATANAKAEKPPLVKRQMWGSYVDELVAYTVKKPRKLETRYFAFANHLYSAACVTSATGQVIEKYSYKGYGERTVRTVAGVNIPASMANYVRGFTGYNLDKESALYYARARMFSPLSGVFIGRDPGEKRNKNKGIKTASYYKDGMSLYAAYFVPNHLDPSGKSKICCIQDMLSTCSYRTNVQGKMPSANGCGSEGGTKFPNKGSYFDFGDCCSAHDLCYGVCGSDRGDCDQAFLACMSASCHDPQKTSVTDYVECWYLARAYYTGVDVGGQGPYDSAQNEGCKWSIFSCCEWDKVCVGKICKRASK